ncbi:hypothetical protein HUJ04_001176 [Dendroctonus ponderosae]|uniref:Small acidic protein-like domain-containing protein n=1 Tax=Dendroctonus ponderosae TaxID=77166 RepID=A0AAR5Q4L6_DENPD|nr:hypothetical protein HUJ04_001176 [Dendroctonus ponderosae]
MNSLAGYGSDDSDESSDERTPTSSHAPTSDSRSGRKPPHEDNYEEVGMDMSEDSNDSSGADAAQSKSGRGSAPDSRPCASRRSASKSPNFKKQNENRRNGRNEERNKEESHRRKDERSGGRDLKDDDRRRDDDKSRDRHRNYRKDRRDDRFGRDRRDRRRSRSRTDRRRSRSPRRQSRSPKPTGSGSKDRGPRGFPSRREKADKRMDRLDKLGIEFKPDNYPASALEEAERNLKDNPNGNRFFIPGITGRFREQIEKRKLLWQKGKEESTPLVSTPAPGSLLTGGSNSTKVYEATTFADDKTSNKFKRLMGIKETDPTNLAVKSTDVLKKQQEMFSSMEAQYEVARTATHTMRGVGLGFGSFQR